MREQIAKYGMASITLLVLAARRNPEVDKLREQGLLTHEEEAWLELWLELVLPELSPILRLRDLPMLEQ